MKKLALSTLLITSVTFAQSLFISKRMLGDFSILKGRNNSAKCASDITITYEKNNTVLVNSAKSLILRLNLDELNELGDYRHGDPDFSWKKSNENYLSLGKSRFWYSDLTKEVKKIERNHIEGYEGKVDESKKGIFIDIVTGSYSIPSSNNDTITSCLYFR